MGENDWDTPNKKYYRGSDEPGPPAPKYRIPPEGNLPKEVKGRGGQTPEARRSNREAGELAEATIRNALISAHSEDPRLEWLTEAPLWAKREYKALVDAPLLREVFRDRVDKLHRRVIAENEKRDK